MGDECAPVCQPLVLGMRITGDGAAHPPALWKGLGSCDGHPLAPCGHAPVQVRLVKQAGDPAQDPGPPALALTDGSAGREGSPSWLGEALKALKVRLFCLCFSMTASMT